MYKYGDILEPCIKKSLEHSADMAFKFVAFAALLAVAQAGHLGLGGLAPAYGTHGAVSYSSIQNHAAPLGHAYAAPYAHAAPLAYAAPLAHAAPIVHAEPSAPAHYDFGYGVSDPHTGDSKTQQESRRGDVVHGSYSLVESDGTKRVVEYSAGPHTGFNAVVHKEPGVHAAPAVHAAPIVAAAPVLAQSYATPALAHSYAAPALAHSYAAPALAHSYAAPAFAHSYAAPVAHAVAPAVASGYSSSVVSHGAPAAYAHHAPVLSHGW